MWEAQRTQVLQTARRMRETGFVVGTAGNVSQRFREPGGRELVAITPSGRHYDTMTSEDIVVLDMQGQRAAGELAPSIEAMMHLAIYRARRNICAVVHTHAVHASIVAVTGGEIPPLLDDQVTFLGGEIKVADYALPGSPELAGNAVAALGPRNAALLANHGALAVGRDLSEAFDNCELLEKTARIYALARMMGDVRALPPHAIEAGKAAYAARFGDAGASAF
jgi:L-fuculose-phosphate aldolase